MKTFVIDASVIIKWIFPEREVENHISQALNLLQAIKQERVAVLQPPHWLAEVMAVIVRLEPKITSESISLLDAMELPMTETSEVYRLACQLSERFGHHLFDTLYHAVALHHGNAELITADEQYYKKACKQKSIIRLADFSIFDG
jgi:predicted nucleic acid-binding protein